jgi:hypothetical protein
VRGELVRIEGILRLECQSGARLYLATELEPLDVIDAMIQLTNGDRQPHCRYAVVQSAALHSGPRMPLTLVVNAQYGYEVDAVCLERLNAARYALLWSQMHGTERLTMVHDGPALGHTRSWARGYNRELVAKWSWIVERES